MLWPSVRTVPKEVPAVLMTAALVPGAALLDAAVLAAGGVLPGAAALPLLLHAAAVSAAAASGTASIYLRVAVSLEMCARGADTGYSLVSWPPPAPDGR